MGCGNSKNAVAPETQPAKASPRKSADSKKSKSHTALPNGTSAGHSPSHETILSEEPVSHPTILSGEPADSDRVVSEDEVEDVPDIPHDGFQPFVEFPTPMLLREANLQWSAATRGKHPQKNGEGEWLPYPSPTVKREVFSVEKYRDIDDHAIKAPAALREGSIADLVMYLCKPAKDDMGKVRSIFRWITAQNLISLDAQQEADPGTPLHALLMLKKEEGSYSQLFVDMCKGAGLHAKALRGLVKGSDFSAGDDVPDNSCSVWSAVMVNNTWRLFDVHWAARQIGGGGFGEWELIDDNGEGAKELEEEDQYMTYKHDESYFATDPECLIYSHYPHCQPKGCLAYTKKGVHRLCLK